METPCGGSGMSENKNAKTPADGPAANRAMTLEEAQQWITTTWLRCQDEVWRQLPTPKKVSKDDVTPPKKEWVGLTADEIWKCTKASGSAVEFHICYEHQNVEDFAASIEAKLKEMNT